jgi:hypothetical protein
MKTTSLLSSLALACAALFPATALAGGGMMQNSPKLDAAMRKLFGQTQAFSAKIQMSGKSSDGKTFSMAGALYLSDVKSRFEMDFTKMQGSDMPPQALAQMKAMGMDRFEAISRPDLKLVYLVYPNMQSCVKMPMTQPSDAKISTDDLKIVITKIGVETVNGHPCVKNQVVVTDEQGKAHASTMWNATDLKNFPVRIAYSENGGEFTMNFVQIMLAKPDASLFEPPADCAVYDNMQVMMQQVMMKRMSVQMQQGGDEK